MVGTKYGLGGMLVVFCDQKSYNKDIYDEAKFLMNTDKLLKSQSVKLSGYLVTEAEVCSKVYHRSRAGQIEFWAHIGKIAEENPELNFNFIIQILTAQQEVALHNTEPYIFGDIRDD